MNINLILSSIAIIWSVLLTVFAVWIYFIFKDLIKISKDKDFSNNTKEIKNIWSEISNIKEASKLDIQKVGLVKFNPFSESGGDHSFSLALLDGNKNGIIITSLHARERTRLYIKEILSGKSKIDLSKEEQKALQLSLE
jgi:hypothetical protein